MPNTAAFSSGFQSSLDFSMFTTLFSKSAEFANLLAGQGAGTIVLGQAGQGTGSLNGIITVDPNDIAAAAHSDQGYSSIVVTIAHELGHQDDNGTGAGLSTQSSMSAAEQVGKAAEGTAYRDEFITVSQLNAAEPGVNATLRGSDPTAQSQFQNLANTDGGISSPTFAADAITLGGNIYAGYHPSTAPNLTYSQYWDDQWALTQATGSANVNWFSAKSDSAGSGYIKVIDNHNGTYQITATNISQNDSTGRSVGTESVSGTFSANGVGITGASMITKTSDTNGDGVADATETITPNTDNVSGSGAIVTLKSYSINLAQNASATIDGSGNAINLLNGSSIKTNFHQSDILCGSNTDLTSVNGSGTFSCSLAPSGTGTMSISGVVSATAQSGSNVQVASSGDTFIMNDNSTITGSAPGLSVSVNCYGKTATVSDLQQVTCTLAPDLSGILKINGNNQTATLGGTGATDVAGDHNVVLANTSGDITVTGHGNDVTAGSPSTVSITNTGSDVDMITDTGGTVNIGQNANTNLAGDNITVNMGVGDSVGLFGGSGITVNTSDSMVNMGTGTHAVINGSGVDANLTGTSGFNITMSNGNIGMWNGVQAYLYGSNNHMTESAGSDINIGGNNLNIDQAAGSVLGLLSDQGVTVNASNATINMATNTQATINGTGDTGNLTGSSGFNVAMSNGTIGMWDGVQGQISGSNDHINESVNSNLGLAVSSSLISGSAGDIITIGGSNDEVHASNAYQVNFAWYTSGGVLYGDYNNGLAGTGTSAAYAGNYNKISFNGDPNGGGGATLITGGVGNEFDYSGAYQLNFAEGSVGGVINGHDNGVPLGTGVSVSANGSNNNYYFNGDPDGNSGMNLTLNGTGLNASISNSTLIGGMGSSTNLTGIGDDFHLNGSNSSVTEISGDKVYIPAGEGNVNVYGSGLTIFAGSSDSVHVYGDNDRVEGGQGDTFDVYGSYDDVQAYDSTIGFGGSDVGDEVYGYGDGGYGWGGYYGGSGGWGYYGYGGYAFSKTTAINGSDIGAIASHDAGLKDQADAITAQAARLQAGAAMSAGGGTAAVFEGPKWSSDTITWSLAAGATVGLGSTPLDGKLDAYVEQAFAVWAAASHLKFREVSDPAQADIRVGWNSFDTANSDVLGYTKLGGQNGEILPHVDITLETPIETALATDSNGVLAYSGTDTEFSQLVLHEIGHALGLADSSSATSIMGAVMNGANRTLDANDIAAIQELYSNGNSGQANNDPAAKSNNGKAAGGGSTKHGNGPLESNGVLGHGSDYRSHASQIIDAIAGFGATTSGSSTTSVAPPTANHDNLFAAAA